MNVYQGSHLPRRLINPVVTTGTFDGIHSGHTRLFDAMKARAAACGGETLVITFNTHPRIILSKSKDVFLLNTFEEKIKLIEKSGIDNVWVLPFTRQFAELTAKSFVEEYLYNKVGLKHLLIGYDHTFGKGGKVQFSELEEISRRLNFSLEKLNAVLIDDKVVSSSAIRDYLINGEIVEANRFLGYYYQLYGRIVRGNQIGKLIGYPTANLSPTDPLKLIPATGVYACLVNWKGKIYKGMGNIGYRPTIEAHNLTIEANIFDFDVDIYNDHITIFFIERIRDERKFGGLQQLKKQLGYDKERVAALFDSGLVTHSPEAK
jgi:riboflavin kinase / FMN adenylyltransferase